MASNVLLDPVGIGLAAPFRFDQGRLALSATQYIRVSSDDGLGEDQQDSVEVLAPTDAERVQVVRRSMRRVVEVRRGSQFMAGESGSLLDTIVMEPNDPTTHSLAAALAGFAVAEQEKRVTILNLSVAGDAEQGNVMRGVLGFRINGTQVIDNAVIFERGDG